jgi:hypothetical protein
LRRNGILSFTVLILLVCTPVFAQQSAGGITLFPSISLRQETGVSSGDGTSYPLNVRLGYVTASSLYLGLMYSNVAGSGPSATSETSYGNSLGYFYGYASFIATYYFTSVAQETSSTAGRFSRSGGTGYQFDFSLMFPATARFSIGPILIFKSFTYGVREDANGISNQSQSETFLFPAIGILVQF